MTGVLAGFTYIITVVPVNILGDGYPNKTIGYLNIIIKCVMFTSHTVIISVSPGQVSNADNIGFTTALVSVNNSGLTTNLSFAATTDKNGTQVKCVDTIDTTQWLVLLW